MSVTIFGDWANAADARLTQWHDSVWEWSGDIDHTQPFSFGPEHALAVTMTGLREFARGFTELLRLGDGASQGTVWGVAQDGLRILGLIPIGRAAVLGTRATGAALPQLIRNIPRIVALVQGEAAGRGGVVLRLLNQGGQGWCEYAAAGNAANFSRGTPVFASVDDVMRAG